ncbi:cysteinyl leukotriene receptor 1-like [Amblyraja radiata]|uniref:cysteinyl leukotriene receptor 1-like n=1 Tax=Amblyraja radiata TaxID=386614 RepID=UPI00140405F5|nr:cysteinyl leukotriene receptor 1-like [Amblyraja radiata]
MLGGHNWTNSCRIDEYKRPVFVGVYSVVLAVGLVCNTAALYVFVGLTRRKTASTIFMTNMAMSDLFFNLTLPYRIAYYWQNHWTLGTFLCRLSTYAFYLNLYASIYFLTALSVFRYVAILHPVRAKTLVSVRRAWAACLGIWLFVGLSSAPFLRASPHMRQGRMRCFEPHSMSWGQILKMNYMALVLGFLLPFLTIVACYGRIVVRLWSPNYQLQRSARSSRKPISMILIVLSSFLFCFLPYHVARTVHLHLMAQGRQCQHQTLLVHKAIVATLCLAAANSCLNPLLYYFVGENFRRLVKSSLTFRIRGHSARSISSYPLRTATTVVPEAP